MSTIRINDILNTEVLDKLESLHGKEITKTVIKRYLDDQENSIGYHLANAKFGFNPFTVMFNDKSDKNCHIFVLHGTIEGVYLLKYYITDDNSKLSIEREYLDYNDLRSFIIVNYDIADLKELNAVLDIINTLSIDMSRFPR